jgi:alpha-tubulin suppressor-like RCC1 family protein
MSWAWPLRSLTLLALGCAVQASPPLPIAPAPVAGPAPAAPIAGRGARVVDLQYGGSFCALREDGRVACWGQNAAGSLGDGSNEARSRPALVPGLDGVQRLLGFPSLGFCALRADRSLWCWGFGYTGDTSLPAEGVRPRAVADGVVDFGFAKRFAGVCFRRSVQGATSCVELRADQTGECVYWADEARSSCLFRRRGVRPVPRDAAEAGTVHFGQDPVSYLAHHSCSLANGVALCQGDGSEGELGDPARPRVDTPAPGPDLRDLVSLTSLGTSSCAVRRDGVAVCWGRNQDGELAVAPDPQPCPGRGRCNARPTALPVTGVAQVLLVTQATFVLTQTGAVLRSRPRGAAGWEPGVLALISGIPPSARLVGSELFPYPACALTRAGEVYCFGRGADVGDGVPVISRTPVPIADVRGAVEVQVDLTGACARLGDGTVTCWGDPEAPRGLRDIVALGQPCALARDGRVWCWGTNSHGEMGLGRRERPGLSRDKEVAHVPLPVPGLRDVTAVSSTLGTTCALDRKGIVRCWGTWGPKSPTLSPMEIRGLPAAHEIWSARGRQCALTSEGQVWCVAGTVTAALRNDLGRAGHLPSHGPGHLAPENDCVIDATGGVHCAVTPAPLPVHGPVKQLSIADDVFTNKSRGCALLQDGSVVCWGPPYCADRSALCVGGIWNHTEKILDGVAQISVGSFLSCAVRSDGSVWCWGRADDGGLGGPPPTDHVARVDLATLTR